MLWVLQKSYTYFCVENNFYIHLSLEVDIKDRISLIEIQIYLLYKELYLEAVSKNVQRTVSGNCIKKMFEHPHAMSCKYTNIGALTNLLPWLLKCRAACRVWLFSLLHPESPDEYSFLYDHTSLWGQSCTVHRCEDGAHNSPCIYNFWKRCSSFVVFVDAAFLQGLFRFKIRRRIVVFFTTFLLMFILRYTTTWALKLP